ncbi:hypothetical protein [Micromonospora sonchi]|uniref:hypothetical protein n=1 Tax=Micromonospora sonchi TaxID=1763543 RepID=UPI001E4679A1|nr:hypothetical protein [Micromonospora sonchi]
MAEPGPAGAAGLACFVAFRARVALAGAAAVFCAFFAGAFLTAVFLTGAGPASIAPGSVSVASGLASIASGVASVASGLAWIASGAASIVSRAAFFGAAFLAVLFLGFAATFFRVEEVVDASAGDWPPGSPGAGSVRVSGCSSVLTGATANGSVGVSGGAAADRGTACSGVAATCSGAGGGWKNTLGAALARRGRGVPELPGGS